MKNMNDLVQADAFLNHLYKTSYEELFRLCDKLSPVIEIGAGSCYSESVAPLWLRSDITTFKHLDLQFDALALPFLTESVGAIVLRDTWHHIPDLSMFLNECQRVLMPGGKIVVSDPYWGLLAKIVYRFLHQERFDDQAAHWCFDQVTPWSSNQALAFIVLRRDRHIFSAQWPSLQIVEHGVRVGPSFLLSGGVSRRTFVPGAVLKWMFDIERGLGKWFDSFRFFFVFEIQKL